MSGVFARGEGSVSSSTAASGATMEMGTWEINTDDCVRRVPIYTK